MSKCTVCNFTWLNKDIRAHFYECKAEEIKRILSCEFKNLFNINESFLRDKLEKVIHAEIPFISIYMEKEIVDRYEYGNAN